MTPSFGRLLEYAAQFLHQSIALILAMRVFLARLIMLVMNLFLLMKIDKIQ